MLLADELGQVVWTHPPGKRGLGRLNSREWQSWFVLLDTHGMVREGRNYAVSATVRKPRAGRSWIDDGKRSAVKQQVLSLGGPWPGRNISPCLTVPCKKERMCASAVHCM
jgi:hypothetical protein